MIPTASWSGGEELLLRRAVFFGVDRTSRMGHDGMRLVWERMKDMEHWKEQLDGWYEEQVEVRHRLHGRPELPYEERETTRFLKETLTAWGIRVEELPGLETGVSAVIEGAHPGPMLVLREDIDALPIQENTGLEFASRQDGVSHACGHDIHTTALLYAARSLLGQRDKLHGSVKLIFQCAEEVGSGAYKMLEAGALQNCQPQAVVGFHCAPLLELGKIGVRRGPSNASFDIFTWTITGQGGHGAYPYRCVDPVVVSAYLITQLQTVVSRFNCPLYPAVLTVGEIHGGTAPNIIPDQVTMRGSMRAFEPQQRQKMLEQIRRITQDCCSSLGAQGEVKRDVGIPSIISDPEIADGVARAVEESLGKEHLHWLPEPSMGSDDFSVWMEACNGRGVQFSVGTHDPACPNSGLGIHVAENVFPDAALKYAAPVLVQFALDYLGK